MHNKHDPNPAHDGSQIPVTPQEHHDRQLVHVCLPVADQLVSQNMIVRLYLQGA